MYMYIVKAFELMSFEKSLEKLTTIILFQTFNEKES